LNDLGAIHSENVYSRLKSLTIH